MEKLQEQNLRINEILASLIQQEQTLTAQIEAAEDRLPSLLAAHALGEITDGELSEEREALIQLKLSLKEIPLTIQGLEVRLAGIKDQLRVARQAQGRKDAERLFKQLLPQLEKRYTRHMEDRLRSLAVTLGRRDEMEPFFLEARNRYDRTPLCER